MQGKDANRQVGALEIDRAGPSKDGEVSLTNADEYGFVVSGWIHHDGGGTPAPRGQGRKGDELRHLDGPWWAYSYRW